MVFSSIEQYKRRERTLRAAMLLSMWAPLAAGFAVIVGNSTTQLADFVRRSMELAAMIIAWLTFRQVFGNPGQSPQSAARLERYASLSVAGALGCSGLVMLGLAAVRAASHRPSGNVLPGLIIAGLGLAVNIYFWQRYRRMNKEQHNSITEAQSQLYRAKSLTDLGVLVALGSIAVAPGQTRWIDLMGTGAVAVYLLWSGLNWARRVRHPLPGPGVSE